MLPAMVARMPEAHMTTIGSSLGSPSVYDIARETPLELAPKLSTIFTQPILAGSATGLTNSNITTRAIAF